MYLRLLDADGQSVSAQPDIFCDKATETRVGTAAGCALALPETGAISPIHATVCKTDDKWLITDQGELTPVWVNGKALGYGETGELKSGDMLRISTLNICVIEDQDARISPAVQSKAEQPESMQIPLMSFQRASENAKTDEPASHRTGDLDLFFGLAHAHQPCSGNDSPLDPLSFFDTPTHPAQASHTRSDRSDSSDNALDALLGIKR